MNQRRTSTLKGMATTMTTEAAATAASSEHDERHTVGDLSSWAARVGVPKELRINKHQIDLAFAVTDYKVEAQAVAPPTLATNQANPPCRCKARRSITSS